MSVDASRPAAADCGLNQARMEGVCAPTDPRCQSAAECAPGYACDPETLLCVPDAAQVRPCAHVDECSSGERCLEGYCRSAADGVDAGQPDADLRDVGAPVADVRPPALDAHTQPRSDLGRDAEVVRDSTPPDSTPEPDARPDILPDMAVDAGPQPFVPPPTPPRGIYTYERLPIGGLSNVSRVAYHPSGDYAVLLEQTDDIQILDATTHLATQHRVPGAGSLYLRDIVFDPSGEFALIVGKARRNDASDGFVVRLDDAAVRTWAPDQPVPMTEVLREPGTPFVAIEYPWREGLPVVLAQVDLGRSYEAILRELDPLAGRFTEFRQRQVTGPGCDDFAFVDNEFGDSGMLVVCGTNGAEVMYYTTLGGIGEWRHNPGNNNLGNTPRVAAHRDGDYALIVSSSGRRIFRFQGGQINDSEDAPRFGTRGVWGIAFQQEGQRALVIGRAVSNPGLGTVIEYRHDEYRCDAMECGMTEVSIGGFFDPPYNGNSNTYLNDAAFRPGCDGGLVVGGDSNSGLAILFQIDNGRPCP